MKKLLLTSFAAVALVGCATYHDGYGTGAPPEDTDVIYERGVGTLRSPGGLDLPREADSFQALPPPVYMGPSGNRLREPEPPPWYPTQAVPPQ